MNVLTKTRKGFVKRAAACIVAGAVAATLIPAAVSAEGQAAEAALWETVSVINMDGFPETTGSIWGYEAEKTADGKTHKVRSIAGPAYGCGHYFINQESKICGMSEAQKTAAPDIAGENVAMVSRNWQKYGHNCSGKWIQGAFASSQAGIIVSGLFDDNNIALGDKVKVTAWVYATDIVNSTELKLCENQNQQVNFRAFTMDLDKKYNTNATENEMSFKGKLSTNMWNKISIEYEVNSANSVAKSIRIDNEEQDNIFPLRLSLAGVKVEKKVNTASSYTKKIAAVSMDEFPDTDCANYQGFNVEAPVNGKTYGVRTHGGGDPYLVGNAGGISAIGSTYGRNTHVIGGKTVAKAAVLHRGWLGTSNGNKITNPKASIWLQNVYADDEISVGDRVRVTVWASATTPKKYLSATKHEDIDTDKILFRAYINDPWKSAAQPGYNTQGQIEELTYEGDLSLGEWHKLTIEYQITEANKNARNIIIDNAKSDEVGTVYPVYLSVAGFELEKFENGGWYTVGENGNASGEIYANNTGVSEGSKLIVAAYEGDTFMGCDILDANGEVSPFSVTGAAKADKVCAYVWDMTTLKPQAGIIGLTKAE